MSKDGVLDALDAMIASFNAQTPAAEAPNAQNKTEDLRGSQPGLGVLGIGRFPKQDTYTENPTGDSDPTQHEEFLSRIERFTVQKAQSPKRPPRAAAALGFCLGRSAKVERPNAQTRTECRWHLEHGEQVPREECAGCRQPLGDGEALKLADGNRVHLDPNYRCLIAWGETWRAAARAAEAWRHAEDQAESAEQSTEEDQYDVHRL